MSRPEPGRYKIIVWGLGSIGSRLARLIRTHFDFEVVAFRSRRENPNDLGIPEIHEKEELDAFCPDIAFITNPTALHVDLAVECAARGMHLFIEKPLSHTLEGTDKLLSIIKEKNLLTYVACNIRFDPIILHLKETLRPERVIQARVHCSSYLPQWRPDQDYRTSYSAKKALGGGVILDLVHEPDYCAWLFGRIEQIEGTAGKNSDLDIETEDFADMVLRHEGGARSSIHLDYSGRVPKRHIEIRGDGFKIEADLLGREVVSHTGREKRAMRLNAPDRDYTYLRELQYFFRCIETGQVPMNSVEEHLLVLKPLLDFKRKAGC